LTETQFNDFVGGTAARWYDDFIGWETRNEVTNITSGVNNDGCGYRFIIGGESFTRPTGVTNFRVIVVGSGGGGAGGYNTAAGGSGGAGGTLSATVTSGGSSGFGGYSATQPGAVSPGFAFGGGGGAKGMVYVEWDK